MSILPHPSLLLGMSALPMSTAPLTSNALAIAGLSTTPAWCHFHHSVTSATAPATCGDAMLVPEQKA